jgi:hypothetical protein
MAKIKQPSAPAISAADSAVNSAADSAVGGSAKSHPKH